jgi:uncharacterized protein
MARIEWDEIKSKGNWRKHGIDFEIAQHVFGDPCVVLFVDSVIEGEERWHAIGYIADIPGVLMVVHTHQAGSDLHRLGTPRHIEGKEGI